MKDERRRFVWSETSFFSKWYESLGPTDKRLRDVHLLVETGRLEFVGGGWVQHDEANPGPEEVVNQIATGHEWLVRHFGERGRPRVGWQIDPFGHSALTPALFSRLGYDAVVINRIHHKAKAELKRTRDMEFVWDVEEASSGSGGGGGGEGIFAHVLHTHYSAPRGYDFEDPGHRVHQRMWADKLVEELRVRVIFVVALAG